MIGSAVDCLTRARRRAEALAPLERKAVVVAAAAWLSGAAIGWTGADAALAAWSQRRLHPPLPSVSELASRLPDGDPRVEWYRAGLALREELARARSGPAPIDPNVADRADWDRLPGIGPRIAEAILAHRDARGPFRGPDDLLAVKGIGPARMAKIAPWLRWKEAPAGGRRLPDLNRVDEPFLTALSGIGPHLASSIVRERRGLHGFRSWADVEAIDGIGDVRLRVLQEATRLAQSRSTTTSTIDREDR
ncbi:MAG: helix-hairpin-helix domain-containing protein [Gemmatimonadota bacterium]|nr:helix-hairpin-helix domain-containing protein [Gemmatimonadota bacterium]